MKITMKAAPAALLLACASVVAQTFPDQPITGQHKVIEYGNEVPSDATFPASGHDIYKFAMLGELECQGRTYVLEVKSTIRDFPGSPEITQAMSKGHCSWSSRDAGPVKVIRFESYTLPAGRADLAYMTRSVSMKDLNGKQFSVENKFYVSRKDIVPAQ
jgi:hypothetical protein